jgi:hypothetical protein
MKPNIQIIAGPFTAQASREEAETGLKQHPQFPKNASYKLDALEGRWVAAISSPSKKQAGPFDEEPVVPDEGGDPAGDFEVDDVIEDDSELSEDLGEDGEESDTDKINHLTELVEKMVDALGLSDEGEGEETPVPEEDMMEEPPPAPPAPAGPAPEPTAVGAPAFSNVQVPSDHPWKSVIGKVRSFNVEEPIGEAKMAQVHKELSKLGSPFGYAISQLTESERNGQRTAKAIITAKSAS